MPQPDQFIASGRVTTPILSSRRPAARSATPPVADRRRGWFELSRTVIRIATSANGSTFVDEIQD
jgi:hypothetical protein